MFSTLLVALAANAAVATATPPAETDPRRMTPSQIRAHNQGLVRTAPDYIRCVSAEETGSLVRKRVSCRTNADWAQADNTGNQNARDTYESMQGKALNSSQ